MREEVLREDLGPSSLPWRATLIEYFVANLAIEEIKRQRWTLVGA